MKRKAKKTDERTKNGKALCALIGAAVTGQNLSVSDDFDLDTALRVACSHNMLPIAYHALNRAGFTGKEMDRAAKDAGNMVFKQAKLKGMENKLSSAFSSKNIPYYILKGTQIQKYYPENMVRITTDSDFYVDEKNIEAVKTIMTDFGFELLEYNAAEKSYEYTKQPRYNIEIHCLLDNTDKPDELEFLSSLLLNPIQDEGSMLRFNDEDMYLQVFFHLYKHFSQSGAGIKMFLDVFVLRRELTLDTKRIKEKLESIGLDRFHSAVLRLCDVLFNGAKSDSATDRFAEAVISGGAFGVEGINIGQNKIVSSDNPEAEKKAVVSKRLGTDKENMKKRYPVLKKAPFLLPFCYGFKAVKCVVIHPKEALSICGYLRGLSSKNIKLKEKILTDVGLYEKLKK